MLVSFICTYFYIDKSFALEDKIDDMRRTLFVDHIERLKQGKCKPENNTIFINLISNLERIGYHIFYILINYWKNMYFISF